MSLMAHGGISDILELVGAVSATLLSLIAATLVYRKEYQSELRTRFRLAIRRRMAPSSESVESRFGSVICNAIRNEEYSALRNIKIGPYMDGYIIDLEFKKKLAQVLIQKLRRYNVTGDRLAKVLEAVEHWRKSSDEIERNILSYLREISSVDEELKPVATFIERTSKKGYFSAKTDQFVEDVKHAVQVAIGQ